MIKQTLNLLFSGFRKQTRIGLFSLVLFLVGYSSVFAADLRLIEAAKARDIEGVRQMLQQQVDVDEQQADGATALHWATHWDEIHLLDLLISAGANVNAADENGTTPLWAAARNGSYAMIERLLKANADPNLSLNTGETPLMTAAEIGSLEVVKALISAGADVNARERQGGQTALMWAVAEGNSDVVHLLIENGANIQDRSKGGYTPLHFASQNNNLESAQALLSMDADVNEISPDKMSPLLLAAASGYDELTQYLLELGADPTAKDYKGFTALHYAAMKPKMIASLSSLLEKGANPNVQIAYSGADHELTPIPDLPFLQSPTRIVPIGTKSGTFPVGATPFYLAAQQRNFNAMRILAEHGANPHLRNSETIYFLGGSGRRVNFIAGTTPLMSAAGMDRVTANWVEYPEELENQALEAVKVAVEFGADVNAVNEYGLTALHAAAFIGADDIIEFLIKSGANPEIKDRFGQTPVSISKHVIVAGLGDYFDVRPRRSSPSTYSRLMKLGATSLELSGIEAR